MEWDVIASVIDIRKNAEGADSQQVVSGGTVTWTIFVTNTGDVTLTNVVVTDPLALGCVQSIANLAAGAGTSFTCSQSNVTSDFTNVITVTGTSPVGSKVSDYDPSSVDVINPRIDVRKNAEGADSQQVVSGGTVTWTIRVENTGDVTLTNVVVTDPLAPDCIKPISDLAAGAGTSFSCSLVNVTGDFTNIITVTGKPPVGPDVSDNDPSSVEVLPTVDLTKTAEPKSLPEPGGLFTFTLIIQNTSSEPVTITALTDTNALNAACQALVGTVLGVGGSTSCQYLVTHTAPGSYANTATVTVEDNEGNKDDDGDDETVTVTDLPSSIQVTKTANPTQLAAPGGKVTFQVEVLNLSTTDNVTINSLTDSIYGDITQVQGKVLSTTCNVLPKLLAPAGQANSGFQCSFTANLVIADNATVGIDETDVVTAKGVDDDQNPVEDNDDANVIVPCQGNVIQGQVWYDAANGTLDVLDPG